MTERQGLIPCLNALFGEFDRIAPSRDHASDGWVGDAAHQNEVSDHNWDETGNVPIHDADHINEVHAIDVDNTLNESDLTMEKVVQFLLGRCRSGAEKRLRYMIYNKRIWEASNGWAQRAYTGSSPHTEHAHFSGSYETNLEASTASWHLEDIPVAFTDADLTKIENLLESGAVARGLRLQPNNLSDTERMNTANAVRAELTTDAAFLDAIAKQVLEIHKIAGTTTPPDTKYLRSLAQVAADPWAMAMRGNTLGGDPVPLPGVFGQILEDLAALQAKVDALAPGGQGR